jgi:ASC-1-like (ASCH) protein
MRMLSKLLLLTLILVGCKSQGVEINVQYEQLSGLAKGDRVLFQENAAGRVVSIQYNDNQTYNVKLNVDTGFAHALTEFSTFHVVDDVGADGHKAIDVRVSRQGGLPLKSGTVVPGARPVDDLADRIKKDLESGFQFFKERIEAFGKDLKQAPETEAYQDLKKSIEALAAEIMKKEKQAREKVKREWLPRIQQELDALRRRLEKLGREGELQPLEAEMERIRRI